MVSDLQFLQFFSKSLLTIPSAPTAIGMIVIFMLHIFLVSSLARSKNFVQFLSFYFYFYFVVYRNVKIHDVRISLYCNQCPFWFSVWDLVIS